MFYFMFGSAEPICNDMSNSSDVMIWGWFYFESGINNAWFYKIGQPLMIMKCLLLSLIDVWYHPSSSKSIANKI